MVDTTDPRALGEELERLALERYPITETEKADFTVGLARGSLRSGFKEGYATAYDSTALRHRFASPQTAGETGELVERLRYQGNNVVNANLGGIQGSLLQAADTIASLTAERDALKHDLERQMTVANEECRRAEEALARCEEMRRTIEREREECAKVAKTYPKRSPFGPTTRAAVSAAIATEIRARAALGSGGGG